MVGNLRAGLKWTWTPPLRRRGAHADVSPLTKTWLHAKATYFSCLKSDWKRHKWPKSELHHLCVVLCQREACSHTLSHSGIMLHATCYMSARSQKQLPPQLLAFHWLSTASLKVDIGPLMVSAPMLRPHPLVIVRVVGWYCFKPTHGVSELTPDKSSLTAR